MIDTSTLSNIKIGAKVNTSQLDKIKGIYFLIKDPKLVPDEDGFFTGSEGTLLYAKPDQDEEYDSLMDQYPGLLVIYNREGDYFEY